MGARVPCLSSVSSFWKSRPTRQGKSASRVVSQRTHIAALSLNHSLAYRSQVGGLGVRAGGMCAMLTRTRVVIDVFTFSNSTSLSRNKPLSRVKKRRKGYVYLRACELMYNKGIVGCFICDVFYSVFCSGQTVWSRVMFALQTQHWFAVATQNN